MDITTGKRISQKLLRNCVKFLSIIHDVLKIAPMEYIKQSSDEIDIRGPETKYDSRKINSYPSKVGTFRRFQSFIFRNYCAVVCGPVCLVLFYTVSQLVLPMSIYHPSPILGVGCFYIGYAHALPRIDVLDVNHSMLCIKT